MGINRLDAANLARFLVEFACLDGPLHSEVRFVLPKYSTAPVCLPGVGFQHRRNGPYQSLHLVPQSGPFQKAARAKSSAR
jgi:hypothetical protein